MQSAAVFVFAVCRQVRDEQLYMWVQMLSMTAELLTAQPSCFGCQMGFNVNKRLLAGCASTAAA